MASFWVAAFILKNTIFTHTNIYTIVPLAWKNIDFITTHFQVAKKLDIEPFHCPDFHFYKQPYNSVNSYRYVVASHGFDDPQELVTLLLQAVLSDWYQNWKKYHAVVGLF
jgi:hypothetical protein